MTASSQLNDTDAPPAAQVEHSGGRWTKKGNAMIVSAFAQHNGVDPDNEGHIRIMSRVAAETWITEAKRYDVMIKSLYEKARTVVENQFAFVNKSLLAKCHMDGHFANKNFKNSLGRMAYFLALHKGLLQHSQYVHAMLII